MPVSFPVNAKPIGEVKNICYKFTIGIIIFDLNCLKELVNFWNHSADAPVGIKHLSTS